MLNGTDPKAIDLPTLVQIREATDFLSVADSSYKVVRVKNRLAVKFGNGISPAEAEIMKLLAANSKVPVPKVYATFKEPEIKITFIIMEYISGDNLQTLLRPSRPARRPTFVS
ncbi:hypothetical protein BDV24DRAFT_160474 [Aspergillus arachidicola]|uniref:Aminoglycoside phosphotransferase domain-containing protein n=1 Tax=Aspergillus arachidicola TaxID=656916 RepID=A0A5N6YFT9_9EURO|nr:hypothetical protein BDV24DRAFT_160474 [Aspergillus arachidicola]